MRYARRQWMGIAGAAAGAGLAGASGLVAAACAPGGASGGAPRAARDRAEKGMAGTDLLYVATRSGLHAIDVAAGKPVFLVPRALPAPDWTRVFAATWKAGATRLAALEPRSGAERAAVTLDGELDAAVASAGGRLVALTPRREAGAAPAAPYAPVGRQRTTILVADTTGRGEPRRFDLEGNFAPEAFSSDERALFLLEYLPPQAPDRYRVRQLNLSTGQGQTQVQALFTRDKRPNLEEMRGTGRTHVFGPGCGTLYTLYTKQPDHVHARDMVELGGTGQPSGHVHAFVHVLSLVEGWAFCLDLPLPFGLGPASAHALAVSRDGWRLYVADASSGVVVDADTAKLQIARQAELGTEPFADWSRAAAQAGPQGTLYLASGSEVVAVDPAGLRAAHRWPVDGVARGLGVGPDGRRIYVGLDGRVVALDAQTGRPTGTLAVPGLERIVHVGQAAA